MNRTDFSSCLKHIPMLAAVILALAAIISLATPTRAGTAAHLVRSFGALRGLQVAPAVPEALIRDVVESLADYAGPDGLVYPIEAVLATARI